MKTRIRPSRFSLATMLLVAGGCGDADPVGAAVVAREVDQAVSLRGEARVVVAFDPDASGRVATVADTLLHHAGRSSFRLGRRLAATPILAGTVDSRGLARLRGHPSVRRIDLDAPIFPLLAEAVPLVRLDLAHVEGYDGSGVTVGVIDTGIQTDHPDLSDSLAGEACFCSGGCCHNGADTDFGPGSAEDLTGHGTHVSGIVTSNGIVAPAGGAPAAELVVVKVLDGDENNQVSDVIAALDWIYTDRPDVDVVNLSLGSSTLFAGACDNETAWTIGYAAAVQNLLSREVLVFSASGNDGSDTEMVAPACIDRVISVGGVWEGDYPTLGPFGGGCVETDPQPDLPVCFGNSNSETDLYAPAGIITSTDIRAGGTRSRVGTSQAAPLAAACAAVLRQLDPAVTADEIETLLEASSTTVVEPKNGLTFPRLDCYEALYSLGDPDNDKILTPSDNCPAVRNADQNDGDGDGAGDACDPCPLDEENDADDDGICGDEDNCPAVANRNQADTDGDGAGDACDPCPLDEENDADDDGICGDEDNCPAAANRNQADTDGDGAGDACDPCPLDEENDADDDGTCGDEDNCPTVPNRNQADADGDGAGDACDFCPRDEENDDADDDGICGNEDNCPTVANTSQADADHNGVGDACEARQPRPDAGCVSTTARLSMSLALVAMLASRRRRRQSRTQWQV